MESSQTAVLHAESRPSDVVEGHISGQTFDAKLHRTRWSKPGNGVFEGRAPFIEMMLSPTQRVRGTFRRAAEHRSYIQLGDVAFIPPSRPLYCHWSPGPQRCVSCSFDIRLLAQRTGLELQWCGFNPDAALNIRNEYVSVGLRRVAEEILFPGFASETQIECALMFVGMQLARHFETKQAATRPPPGVLGPKQLSRLRSMLIDTPGSVPSIAELASACGMGGRQLAESYRRSTGITLRRFIADARLDRAKILLMDPRILIKQVAFDSGFKTPAAFAAAFRQATGRTPADYRTILFSSAAA